MRYEPGGGRVDEAGHSVVLAGVGLLGTVEDDLFRGRGGGTVGIGLMIADPASGPQVHLVAALTNLDCAADLIATIEEHCRRAGLETTLTASLDQARKHAREQPPVPPRGRS